LRTKERWRRKRETETIKEQKKRRAIIKTEVAVNKVGIIKTPNHPM
jgi:hypothetical protein